MEKEWKCSGKEVLSTGKKPIRSKVDSTSQQILDDDDDDDEEEEEEEEETEDEETEDEEEEDDADDGVHFPATEADPDAGIPPSFAFRFVSQYLSLAMPCQ